jgi:hypothetical protein
VVSIQLQITVVVSRAVGVGIAIIYRLGLAVVLQGVHGTGTVGSVVAGLPLGYGSIPVRPLDFEEEVGLYGDARVLSRDAR